MKKQQIAICFGIVCFVLAFSIFAQAKSVKNIKKTVGTSISKNAELIDEVFKTEEQYNNLYAKLEQAEAKLEIIRKQAISGNEEDKNIEQELKENNLLLGLTEITGEGIIITLDDNRNVEGDEINISQFLVHEEDLLQVINELFNAGADAIAINGNRIVSATSILCDGNIIRVNGKIITVPIEIKAICSKTIYNTLIRPQGYLQLMANEGVLVNIETSNNIIIPKYDGIFSNTYITRGDN